MAVTNVGFNIGIRRLLAKSFIEMSELWDDQNGEPYDAMRLTDSGWRWIEENETLFILHRPTAEQEVADIPF